MGFPGCASGRRGQGHSPGLAEAPCKKCGGDGGGGGGGSAQGLGVLKVPGVWRWWGWRRYWGARADRAAIPGGGGWGPGELPRARVHRLQGRAAAAARAVGKRLAEAA